MKITEKLYIERLEGMVKKYKKDLCRHCPMIADYGYHRSVMLDDRDVWENRDNRKACRICRKLTARYNFLSDLNSCPCGYYHVVVNYGVTKGCMSKVAWKVIRGWKKDHKGGGK